MVVRASRRIWTTTGSGSATSASGADARARSKEPFAASDFKTTVRDRDARPAPDLFELKFSATAPDQLWVADITYVLAWAGFLKPLVEAVNSKLQRGQKLPPGFKFHHLRHTAASLRLTQGDHPKVVQEMLGHARISITLDLYSHLMPSLQVASAELFDKALSKMAKASKCVKSV
jgi:integrase